MPCDAVVMSEENEESGCYVNLCGKNMSGHFHYLSSCEAAVMSEANEGSGCNVILCGESMSGQ